MTPNVFRQHILKNTFPSFGISKIISCRTATHWMYKLGFKPQEYHKSLYFDGHERPDVVEARKKYIQDFKMYRKRSQVCEGENLDVSVPVYPELLGDSKETVVIFHDESTIHAKEKPRLAWLLPGTQEIRSKSSGQLIHISDFILETTGHLKLSDDQFLESQTWTGIKP